MQPGLKNVKHFLPVGNKFYNYHIIDMTKFFRVHVNKLNSKCPINLSKYIINLTTTSQVNHRFLQMQFTQALVT